MELPKTLLLNATYEVIGFISFKRLIKLLFHDNGSKVEVIAEWDFDITWASGRVKHPATVRLKKYVKNVQRRIHFNRKAIFKRDNYICQYCSEALTSNQLTLDHILPRSRGGISSWLNCATCCLPCNRSKSNKTPEEAGMKLINAPTVYNKNVMKHEFNSIDIKHIDWQNYFK